MDGCVYSSLATRSGVNHIGYIVHSTTQKEGGIIMKKGTGIVVLTIILALVTMLVVGSAFPQFESQLGTFFTYFTFIGLILLLVPSLGKRR